MFKPNNLADNVSRPFIAAQSDKAEERIAHALEFLCSQMARIDHNIEILAGSVKSAVHKLK